MGQLSLTTPRIEASGSNVWKTAVNELLSNETQSTTNGTLNSRDTSRRKSSPLIHVQVAFVSFTSVAGQRAKGIGEQFPRRCSCGAPRRRIAPVSAVRLLWMKVTWCRDFAHESFNPSFEFVELLVFANFLSSLLFRLILFFFNARQTEFPTFDLLLAAPRNLIADTYFRFVCVNYFVRSLRSVGAVNLLDFCPRVQLKILISI